MVFSALPSVCLRVSSGPGRPKFAQQKPVEVHPMKEYRRVPLAQLRKRLQVEEYERETPYEELALEPAMVRIRMKQHAG